MIRGTCILALVLAPIPAASQSPQPADAVEWFKGCAALVQETSSAASTMDSNCVANAADYCEIGRPDKDRSLCFAALTRELEDRTEALIEDKPDASALSGFWPRTFESSWQAAEEKDHSEMCQGDLRPEDRCALITAMYRWTSARTALRVWKRY